LTNDQTHDVGACRAEGHSNTDVSRAPRDGVCHHPADLDRRQQDRYSGKDSK
jgi:hypothetical protein